jgi:hypothetical protein
MQKERGHGAGRLLAVFAVGIIIGLVPGVFFYQQSATQASQVSSDQAQISSASGQIATYSTSVSNLNARDSADASTISKLRSELVANQSEAAALQGEVSSLNTTATADNATITNLNSKVQTLGSLEAVLQSQVDSLNAQVLNLSSIIGIGHTTSWLNASVSIHDGHGLSDGQSVGLQSPAFAGYFSVTLSGNASAIYVSATWSSEGVNFSQQWTLSQSGTVSFPVLPQPSVLTLIVGANGNAEIAVAAEYHF